MELSNIVPREASFTLKSTGRTYKLRLINLEDENWIQEEFQGDFVAIFEDNDKLSRLIYRLIKDKTDFIKKEVIIVDEDGEKTTESIGGYRLLKRMTCGVSDKCAMIQAFNETLGVSHPVDSEDSEEPTEESKKKA